MSAAGPSHASPGRPKARNCGLPRGGGAAARAASVGVVPCIVHAVARVRIAE